MHLPLQPCETVNICSPGYAGTSHHLYLARAIVVE